MSPGSKPQRIEPEFHTKIWGSPRVEPWFEPRGDELTGEVWFPADDLLIKFLFTAQDLSIQVHPDDAHARAHENSCGKTEMWHILRADPGARIALGFEQPISAGDLVSGAKSGKIMEWLQWVEVRKGDTYLIPAGTVHAIGAGITLCEIQQNSDITYRLYDYGRDRPLHLEQASRISDLGPHAGKSIPRDVGGGVELLAECAYFRTYRVSIDWDKDAGLIKFGEHLGSRFLIALEGACVVNGIPVSAGQVLKATESLEWWVAPGSVPHSGAFQFLLTG